MNDFFFKENTGFTPFTLQHLLLILILITFGVILIKWAKKQPERTQIVTGNILAITISSFVIVGTGLKIYSGDFDYQKNLPLHLCSFMALIIPVLSLKRKYLHYEVLFFLILTGTFHSLITPSSYNFLNFEFFRYWFVHAGLVIFMMYATYIYNMRPTLKSVWKSYLGFQAYMIIMFTINYFLGSNYFYTNRKPDAASMLDLFGEWPYYVLIVNLIVIPYFLLIYLPFHLTRNRNKA